jgi:hypothetical protein
MSIAPDRSRRLLIKTSASLAGRLAASAIVSLPVLASLSKRAKAVSSSVSPSRFPRCFVRGTRVLTPQGEVPIEDLAIDALVETLSGPLPVKWIGRQSFRKDSPSWHWSVAPIRIARFALSDHYPNRDLYLSPKHSVFIDGRLVPVEWLVNGRSIELVDSFDVVDYFHIELETHEVVFANRAPSETLLIEDGYHREDFANFVEHEMLYGRDEQPAMKPFAPVLKYEGGRGELERLLRLAVSPVVDVRDPIQRARARLAARAGLVAM